MATPHVPVLLEQAIQFLAIRPDGVYVDATLGAAGHAQAICERLSPAGRLVGIDQDPDAIEIAQRRLSGFECRVDIVHGNFSGIERILDELKIESIDGALADLGVSSMQFDRAERGFSFDSDAPVDMRMDPGQGAPAWKLIRDLDQKKLARIFYQYGQQPLSGRVAAAIKAADQGPAPMTGVELRKAVLEGLPARMVRTARMDPATRVFQALRIAVNEELEVLPRFLESAHARLAESGRLVLISFHSLEDRIVKRFFVDKATGCRCPRDFPVCRCYNTPSVRILTRKPVGATDEQVSQNTRARSAKLRTAEKIGS